MKNTSDIAVLHWQTDKMARKRLIILSVPIVILTWYQSKSNINVFCGHSH